MRMNFSDAVEAVFSRGMYGQRPGVELSYELLSRLDKPHRGLKLVHIAGTNGKGSTTHFSAALLSAAGHKTGEYTSPHLVSPVERIRVDGQCISDKDFARLCEKVLAEAEHADAASSDILLSIAMLYFKERGCEYSVIETGLGGRLDSTSALTEDFPPEVCCITNIGLDHTAVLGDTLKKIAGEKAGIIKCGTGAVVIADMAPEAAEVIVQRCIKLGVEYRFASKEEGADAFIETVAPALRGTYQEENLLNVYSIIKTLGINPFDYNLPELHMKGRLELIEKEGVFLIADGAHNPQGAGALSESLVSRYPGNRFFGITGILRDKDYKGVLEPLLPLLEEAVVVEAGAGKRRTDADSLMKYIAAFGVRVRQAESVREALMMAPKGAYNAPCTIAFGSFALIGEIEAL